MTDIRPSPTSSATLYKVNTKKKGNDNNTWIVTENKNGIKRWKLYKKVSKKASKKVSKKASKKVSKKASKIFSDLFFGFTPITEKKLENIISENENSKKIHNILKNKIIPEINNIGIETFIIPLLLSDTNVYWSDYAPTYIENKYNKEIEDNYMYFTFYLNNQGDKINFDRPININYSTFNKDTKIKILDIFTKYLKDNFEWNGSNTQAMRIHYKKINSKRIDKTKIKDDDYYPQLYIILTSKINLLNNNREIQILIEYFKNLNDNYNIEYDYGKNDFSVTINKFENSTKEINKIKNFIKKQDYIKKYNMYLSYKDENNEIIEDEII